MKQAIKKKIVTIVVCGILFNLGIAGIGSAQERMYVKSTTANIRMEPDVNSQILWEVEKYHPILVIEKKGKWFRFKDYQNDVAWIHSSLLAIGRCVITTVKTSNVRERATTKSRILFTVARGVPFKVLADSKGWLKVKHADGDIGWISKKLVW
jgi:SH3-like domain-containing protein